MPPTDWLYEAINRLENRQQSHAAEMRLEFSDLRKALNVRAEEIDVLDKRVQSIEDARKVEDDLARARLTAHGVWTGMLGGGAFMLLAKMIDRFWPAVK